MGPVSSSVTWLARLAFGVWLVLCTIGAGTLMVGHWYTLPAPDPADARLVAAMNGLRPPGDRRWLAVHVLYSSCPCSVRVLDHLFESSRPEDLDEIVLLVERDPELEARAAQARFRVNVVDPETLGAEYGIEAAPMMVVLDPSGAIRYAGGYTERKQGPDIRDLETIRSLQNAGSHTVELPLFGCAVSFELQQILDPLKLKY